MERLKENLSLVLRTAGENADRIRVRKDNGTKASFAAPSPDSLDELWEDGGPLSGLNDEEPGRWRIEVLDENGKAIMGQGTSWSVPMVVNNNQSPIPDPGMALAAIAGHFGKAFAGMRTEERKEMERAFTAMEEVNKSLREENKELLATLRELLLKQSGPSWEQMKEAWEERLGAMLDAKERENEGSSERVQLIQEVRGGIKDTIELISLASKKKDAPKVNLDEV